tara:strand:- start:1743 stop:1934 length:192 start_codon:yes stop_codon:yes gene_type:complete
MEHETYTIEGIQSALRLIHETRVKIAHETVADQTHVLVDIRYFCELLNDIEDYICGNLEDEIE